MSLINKMLQELDRRNAMGSADGSVPPQQVRAVQHAGTGHEWFWRTLALLSMVAVGWVAWVAYQMQPRSLATEMALNAGGQPSSKSAPAAAKDATPPVTPAIAVAPQAASSAASVPLAVPSAPPPVMRAEVAPTPPELFKLALSIDRPVPERARLAVKALTPSRLPVAKESGSVQFSKKDLPRTSVEEAEILFRRGANSLNRGRVGEAQQDFAAALAKHPGHEPSRQASVAILIERRQLNEARQLLEEGLAVNPAQTHFAAVLSRIHIEGGDYGAAAKVLEASLSASTKDAEYQLLYGAVLQRLGRHAEALDAFQRASNLADQSGPTWVAMGVSYEAIGRKADALEAYRRSISAGFAAQDIRTYAENRIRALN